MKVARTATSMHKQLPWVALKNEQVPRGQELHISNQSRTARLSAIAPPTCWHFHLSTGSHVQAQAKLRVGKFFLLGIRRIVETRAGKDGFWMRAYHVRTNRKRIIRRLKDEVI